MPTGSDESKTDDSATRGPVVRVASDEAKAEDSASVSPQPFPLIRPIFAPAVPPPEEQERLRIKQAEANSILMRERLPSGPPCPWCGHDEYSVGPVDIIYPQVGAIAAAVVTPLFQVTCITCGYVSFFNPRVAGLLDETGAVIPPPYPPIPPPEESAQEEES